MKFLYADFPDPIKHKIFKFLNGEEPISNFEQWIYATKDLEELLTNTDYLHLISIDFSKQSNKYEIGKILEQYISIGEYETWKLKRFLAAFINQEVHSLQALSNFYELYCDGYFFLNKLGLGYGLTARVPSVSRYSEKPWEELSDEQQQQLIASLAPEARREAQKVLSWLEKEKIIITGQKCELDRYLFIDKRTIEDLAGDS